MSGQAAWTLSATCRCLTEDLGLGSEACDRPIPELVDAHQVIADFVKKRGAHPIGNETLNALLPKLVAYSLHSGRYRAATWHHEAAGIVWLLAARWHEQGSEDDSYPYLEHLLRSGRLLPTRADVERLVDQRRPTFARALQEDVPLVRRGALDHPGDIQEEVIGGRVRVRVAFENDTSGILYVAITRRLLPGTLPLPPAWDVQLLAAFFSGVPLEDIEYIDQIAGCALRPGEVCYCSLIQRDRTPP
jgi:hypothetical protein